MSEASSVAAARSARTAPQAYPQGPWAAWPSLLVYAHATAAGMRVTATLYRPKQGKHGAHEVLFRHQWRPAEVSELDIVEWARRALARWLQDQLLPETD